jgi:DNA mismatch endonuclease, patch repair protein
MSQIRSKDTSIELRLRKLLIGTYLRYQPKMYGHPDFGSQKYKIAVFIDGCFWHRCRKHFIKPKSNCIFWMNKITRNVKRDKFINNVLRKEGYIVLRFWEHQVKSDISKCVKKIIVEVKKRQ